MLSTLRERLVRHPLAAWAIGLALLAGTLALGAPYGARIFRVSREFRDRPGLYERILAALPEDGAWQFDALSYPSCGVKVRLVHARESRFVHYLSSQSTRPPSRVISKWFALHVPSKPEHDRDTFDEAAAAIGAALEAHAGDESPWEMVQTPSNLPGAAYAVSFALLAGMLTWVGRRTARGATHPYRDGLGLMVITLAAFLFRRFASPHAPLHANLHELELLDHLLHPALSPYPSYSGRCQEGILDLLFLVLPRSLDAYWTVVEVVGAATAAAGAAAAWVLFRSRWAAATAGILLALSPHLARVSTSMGPFVWAAPLLLIVLATLHGYVRTQDPLLLATGLLAGFLLTHLHLTTLPFVALPMIVLVTAQKKDRTASALPLVGGFLALALVAWPHAQSQWELNVAEGLGSIWTDPALLATAFSSQNLFFLPEASPMVRMGLALGGLVALFVLQRRLFVFLLLCLPLLLPCFTVRACFTDLVRYQALALVFLCIPAAGAVALLAQRLPVRWACIAAATLAITFGLELPRTASSHFALDVEAQQFSFMRDAARLLPERGILVLPPRVREYRAGNYFPRTLLDDAGKAMLVVHGEDFQERVRRDGWPDEEVFAFRSLHEYQVLHALQDPELSDIPSDVVPRIEGRLSDWREFVDRHTDSCPATLHVQSPGRVVASVPMEFNRQQEAPMELALCRLARAE